MYTEDAVLDLPQSGERFVGVENMKGSKQLAMIFTVAACLHWWTGTVHQLAHA